MAERTLTGEFGNEGEHVAHPFPTVDRDNDCVPEIDDAHLPAMLAGSVTLHIDVEQGGALDPDASAPLLDALAAYVNFGIPLPIPPATDPALVARGRAIFERADVGCAACHSGPRFTDSGQGNPGLELGGAIRLHDVGTCATGGAWPDNPGADVANDPRTACDFDTPSLSGIASSPPYLHDGSAPTLRDVLERTRGRMGDISSLSADDEAALVEFLRSL
jgi:mono/diheme cytochrome c family protein